MARKKTKKNSNTKKPKKAASKAKKKQGKSKAKSKNNANTGDDSGLIVIEDNLEVDKNAELEARKAYLEEARSQEASD